jgi:hypothetical protein
MYSTKCKDEDVSCTVKPTTIRSTTFIYFRNITADSGPELRLVRVVFS